MQYREFKKLGIKVSAFGIGCMRFPTVDTPEGKKVDLENAKKIIRMAIDQGVNYVDTAYVYSDKTNESIVGEALSDGYREKVYLATKLPTMICEKAEDMQRFFDEQLAALRTDYIDFYLVHALDRKGWDKMKSFGVREFLDKLKAEGKHVTAVLGFGYKEQVFCEEEFKAVCDEVLVTTNDGSYGIKGFVTTAMEGKNIEYLYACGPEPMLKALHKTGIPGQLSFEARMGCGFGGCMGCSCKTLTGYKRICVEGPVMLTEEVTFDE